MNKRMKDILMICICLLIGAVGFLYQFTTDTSDNVSIIEVMKGE